MPLQDPGSILSNAVFGPGWVEGRTYDGWMEDDKGDWYQTPTDERRLAAIMHGLPFSEDPVRMDPTGFFTPEYFVTDQGLPNQDPRWRDNTQIKVLDKIEGGYLVMAKTGDKTGTVYAVMKGPDDQYRSAGVVKNDVPFDTNSPWWKENIGILSVIAAPIMAYAGQVIQGAISAYNASGGAITLSAALDAGFANAGAWASGASAFPTGVADPFTLSSQFTNGAWTVPGNVAGSTVNPLYDLSQGNSLTGPGTRATTGLAVPDSLASDVLLTPGLEQTVAGLPGGPFTVADLTAGGIPTFGDPFSISSLPNQTQTNWGIPPGGYPGAGIPPGGGLDPSGNVVGPDPNTFPPGTEMPGGDVDIPPAPPNSGPPAPPGTPPTQPPGGNTPSNPNQPGWDPFSTLLSLFDAYNKYAGGKDIMDFANRIYGKADWFENELQQTYQNPDYYFNSPEFQSLARVTENKLRRRDAKLGTMSNDTAFANLFRDQALTQGLTPYRSGLVSAANLGKQNSSTALKGFGEGLNMRNGALSPVTFNQGNQGGNAINQTNAFMNDIRQFGGTLLDIWDWGSSFFD